jgi:RNA polymerase sigma-70 factor (ECF subfamily)
MRRFSSRNFFSALKAKDNFKGNSSEKTWLTSILKNKIIDEYRKKGKKIDDVNDEIIYQTHFDNADEDNAHWKMDTYPRLWDTSTIDQMNSTEYYKILHQCIQRLSPIHMSILQEKYFEETPSEKICKDFNISKSNYWVTIHRINLNLRKCLEINWFNS